MALASCQSPPPVGWVSVLETECQFVARPAGEASAELHIGAAGVQTWFQDIFVHPDSIPAHGTADTPVQESAFLPVEEHWLKKAVNTWRDHGAIKALEILAVEASDEGTRRSLPKMLASYALGCFRRVQNLWGSLSPQSLMTTDELCQQFSPQREWETSPVRGFALHPRLPYIAIARQSIHLTAPPPSHYKSLRCQQVLKDDAIELKNLSQPDHRIVLRDKKQRSIMCLQWAPHCNSLLAVGTSTGVLLWNVEPTVATTRLLTSWVRVETSPNHTPVSALSWSPQGNFLVSASPSDTNLITWDIPMGVATRVRRAKGGGLALVSWSPDGQRVFAASVSAVFRVWETQGWTCEKWTHPSGRCKAACWSPVGDILLFALEGDSSIYYLSFHGNELGAGSLTAIKCADLSPCTHMAGGEEIMVGGSVQSMAWDRSGERLAVIFTSDSPSVDMVAILRTRTAPMVEMLPGGFIRGHEGEVPLQIDFYDNCAEGALLATAWSSGRLSFTPLHFQPSHPPSFLNPAALPHTIHSANTPLYSTRAPRT